MQMLMYGRVMPFIEFFARVDAVDAAAIMETARNFIIDKASSFIYEFKPKLRLPF